jgi:hypothetical protein
MPEQALLQFLAGRAEPGEPDEHRFCGHCGAVPSAGAEALRVCQRCGLGVILAVAAVAAPAPSEPFFVVDSSLALCALSRSGEQLFGIDEPAAVHRSFTDFLEEAEPAPGPENALVEAVLAVAAGAAKDRMVPVVLRGAADVRFLARIGRCGPPAAVLVVLRETNPVQRTSMT